MKIYTQELIYCNGDLRAIDGIWEKPRLCVNAMRAFFDIPKKAVLKNTPKDKPLYIVSVNNRKSKAGLAVRIDPKTAHLDRRQTDGMWGADGRKIQVECVDEAGEHIRWATTTFYYTAATKLMELFDGTGKEILYVALEEA